MLGDTLGPWEGLALGPCVGSAVGTGVAAVGDAVGDNVLHRPHMRGQLLEMRGLEQSSPFWQDDSSTQLVGDLLGLSVGEKEGSFFSVGDVVGLLVGHKPQ